ncbi:MAG TPA: 6-phosphogluconolactonase [Armatimonadota bacterium]|nr:6-phosphogluconolactonase [Armatimonadota bacterium]
MMHGTVTVYPHTAALAAAGASLIADRAAKSHAARGRFTLVLAGGGTPRALYAALPASLDWPRVHVFWGDERCVPPDSPESNFRMAAEALLSRVPLAVEHIHRMPGELAPPAAADAYDAELRRAFPGAAWPRFDLLLLGLGEDGHVASLFPNTAALEETARWVAATYVPRLDAWRLTLTLPVITHAAEVVMLVAGRHKAAILRQVLLEDGNLPAQRVAPVAGALRWLVDAEAAALLDPADYAHERNDHAC